MSSQKPLIFEAQERQKQRAKGQESYTYEEVLVLGTHLIHIDDFRAQGAEVRGFISFPRN
jgi:hypothetical protein